MVISVIALLMAILMPALAKVRKQAAAVVCMANLKQWGLVWSMYTGDNEGYFGSGLVPAHCVRKWNRGAWVLTMQSYMDEPQPKLLFCPIAKKPGGPPNQFIEGDYVGPGDVFKAWG